MIQIASALSTRLDTAEAIAEAAGRVSEQLRSTPDLVMLFASAHHAARDDALMFALRDGLPARHLLGCTCEWVVGEGREVEEGPALCVWAACMPGADVETFRLDLVRTSEGAAITGFPDLETTAMQAAPHEGLAGPSASPSHPRAMLLLGDPYSFPVAALLEHAAPVLEGIPVIGGMASGGSSPGEDRLYRDFEVYERGAVGAIIRGDVAVHTVVSQGCRPVGDSYIITRSEGNVIHELAGRPALARLQEVYSAAGEAEKELLRGGVHIGVVVDEYKESFGRGDFLVRNVMGADQQAGSIVVGERVTVGTTVQFHVRDAVSADEDLRLLLDDPGPTPAGALMFTCNGRGSRLFGTPDHDARAVAEATSGVPVAGMFCSGEIGPVGPRSFLHGFTCSLALFCDPV